MFSKLSCMYWGLHNWKQYVNFDFTKEMYSIFLISTAHTEFDLKVCLIKPNDLYALEAIDL